MTNSEIAGLLKRISAAYIIRDEKKYRFQIIAYNRAAESIEHSASEAKDLWEEGKLGALPGIGPSIQGYLEEYFKTGKVKHFDNLLRGLPEAMFPLLDIPGFGPKKAYKLTTTLKLKDSKSAIDDLEKAAREGKIRVIEGFGEKSEGDILDGIHRFRVREAKLSRMTLPYAHQIAEKVIAYLKKSPHVIKADPLGSLRRMVSTVGDIDIAVSTKNPKEVLNYFVKYPSKRVLEKGTATASLILESGAQVDLMVQPPEGYGALLQHFTGSKNHNIHLRELAMQKGMSLSEYGIKIGSRLKKYTTEKSFYQSQGMDFIPPELREDTGEIEAALNHRLPKLVELKDIKGDLHIHSSYDLRSSHDLGKNPMEEILNKAVKLGYEYVTFSEHNPSITNHSQNEILSIMKKRNNIIEQLKLKSKNVRIINMLEIDILADGNLAMSDEILQDLEGVIVSVHSSFNQSRDKMTARVLNALKNPYAKILGHPTGRLLEKREGYELKWDEVFDLCLEYNKALEINAWPDRLDLPDVLVREAVKKGVKMVISTDAHAVQEMDLMYYGVSVARRGWAKKSDILNTMGYNEFIKWIRKRS